MGFYRMEKPDPSNRFRQQNKRNKTPNPTPTPEAKALQARMGLQWPGKEKDKELRCIQISWNNYEDYRKFVYNQYLGLQSLSDKTNAKTLKERGVTCSKNNVDTFVCGYISSRLPSAALLVDIHLRDICEMAWTWEQWRGNILDYVWKENNAKFNQMLLDWLRQCGRSWKEWLRILSIKTK